MTARPHDREAEGEAMLRFSAAAVMLLALVFGGASYGNLAQVTFIEAAASPTLLYGLWRVTGSPVGRRLLFPLSVMGTIGGLGLAQLIPLPPSLWDKLPGHAAAAQALALAGVAAHWRAYSLAPVETGRAVLALIPPCAMFLAAALLPERGRRWLMKTVVATALISILIGMIQSSQDRLDFYGTAKGFSPGFFSNRNHEASLIVSTLPFVAYLTVTAGPGTHRFAPIRIALGAAAMLVLVAGLVIVKSRAGVVLLGPSLALSVALLWRADAIALKPRTIAVTLLAIFGAVAIGLYLAAPFLDRFSQAGLVDGDRSRISLMTAVLGLRYLPFGSGIGSFMPVFSGAEPIAGMAPIYWNHAHDDYAELWLESGLAGLAVLATFALWSVRQTARAWLSDASQANLAATAGSITGLILVLHSGVDYPLRTLALSCVFAFACGLLALPVRRPAPDRNIITVKPRLVRRRA